MSERLQITRLFSYNGTWPVEETVTWLAQPGWGGSQSLGVEPTPGEPDEWQWVSSSNGAPVAINTFFAAATEFDDEGNPVFPADSPYWDYYSLPLAEGYALVDQAQYDLLVQEQLANREAVNTSGAADAAALVASRAAARVAVLRTDGMSDAVIEALSPGLLAQAGE